MRRNGSPRELLEAVYEGFTAKIEICLPPPQASDPYAMRWLYDTLKGADWRHWFAVREEYVRRYGWALASAELLERLVREMRGGAPGIRRPPALSICAGRGYIEWQLQQRGVNIKAVDYDFEMGESARRYLQARAYTEVDYGGALNAVAAAPDADLLIIWPPWVGDWQAEMLRATRCRRVYYVGEPRGDSTGTDEFHAALAELFPEVEEVDIPAWWAINDRLYIYERKAPPPR